MKPAEPLGDRLRAGGHRLTAQRRLILDVLRAQAATVTATELLDHVRERSPATGRATVFRNLDMLVAGGLVQRFERDGHVYAYAACSETHHHHAVCERCHRAMEIGESLVLPVVESLATRHGFTVSHATLDFYGVCADCR